MPDAYDDILSATPGAADPIADVLSATPAKAGGPQLLTEEPAGPVQAKFPKGERGAIVSAQTVRNPLREVTAAPAPGEQRIGRMPDQDVIDRVGQAMKQFWYGSVGTGETLLSKATTPAPSDPALAAIDKNRTPVMQTPLVRPEVFAGDTRGPHRAILEAAGGLTTPENASLLVGMKVAGAIPGVAQALSGGFATQMLTDALKSDPEWSEASARGDNAVMSEIATRKGIQLLMGLAAGAHAVSGETAGVRENRTTDTAARTPEMRTETAGPRPNEPGALPETPRPEAAGAQAPVRTNPPDIFDAVAPKPEAPPRAVPQPAPETTQSAIESVIAEAPPAKTQLQQVAEQAARRADAATERRSVETPKPDEFTQESGPTQEEVAAPVEPPIPPTAKESLEVEPAVAEGGEQERRNPFREKAERARKQYEQLSRPTARDEAMAEAFPLGTGYGRSGGEKRIERSVSRAAKAEEFRKEAEWREAQAAAFDEGKINAQGRRPAANAEAAAERRKQLNERTESAKAERSGKENWQVRGTVYADSARQYGGNGRKLVLSEHREVVEQALKDGKPVPPEVLAEYPDLKSTEPPAPVEAPRPTEAQREPWQMTESEYASDAQRRYIQKRGGQVPANAADNVGMAASKQHERLVREALEQGKPVPPEVLKEYPELQGKAKAPKVSDVLKAKARLKARAKQFVTEELGEQSFELSTQDFQDLATVGRDLIQRGTHRVNEWKEQMADTFGPWVQEYLDRVWDEVQKVKRAASPAYTRKGDSGPGFMIRVNGDFLDLEENARHYNMVRDLEGELRKGGIRGRGNGIEYRSEEVDPEALRNAVKRVAGRYPEVFVDGPNGSLVYDSAELAANRFSLALTKGRRVSQGWFGDERGSLSLRKSNEKPLSIVEQGAEYAANPSAFRAALDFLRPAESRIADQGEAGAKLSKLLGKAQDEGEVAAGKRIVALRDSGLLELSKQDQANLVDVLEGRADPASDAVKKAFEGIRGVTDEIAGEAEKSHVRVKEKRTAMPGEDLPEGAKLTGKQQDMLAAGKKVPYAYIRPFRRRDNFYPHVIPSTEALKSGAIRQDVIDNLVRLDVRPGAESAARFLEEYRAFVDKGGRSESLEKFLVDSGQAKSRGEAFMLLTRFRKRHIRRQGSLEYSRQVDLPFYDPNPGRVLPPFVHSASLRLAQIQEFGQANEMVNHLVRQISEAGAHPKKVAKVRLMVDRALRMVEEPDADSAKLSRTLRMLQGFKLGLSAIPNVSQGALNSLLASDLRSTLAGAKGLMSKEGRRFAMQSGASLEGVVNEMVNYAGGENAALSKFLKGVGFTATEQANRIFAANAGVTYARRMLDRLKANPQDGRALKVLDELGLDTETLLKKGKIGGDDALMAAKKFSDLTQFRADAKDLPLFASTPTGKVFFQFKQYIYGQTRLLHREVVEEFSAGRFGRGTRALLVLGVVFPMAGEVIQDLRSMITGKKRDSDALKRYFDDMAATGALGVLQDAVSAAAYGRLAEWIVGPTGGEAIETFENAVRDAKADRPLSEWRKLALAKQAFRRIPLLGPVMVNRIFGKQKKEPVVREPLRRRIGRRQVVY